MFRPVFASVWQRDERARILRPERDRLVRGGETKEKKEKLRHVVSDSTRPATD